MKQFVKKKEMKYQIGVDEVGRGPIAGPVAVGAFVFLNEKTRKKFKKVRESKQLSEKQREEWFAVIEKSKRAGYVDFAVSFQSEKVIDTKGLSWAIKKCLADSLKKIKNDREGNSRFEHRAAEVLLDGGLKAPIGYSIQKTIIKGDEKIMVIALASICAKVLRDRKMVKLGLKYPKYGFEIHKGYGTSKHYAAIKEWGMLDAHRKSFLRKILS